MTASAFDAAIGYVLANEGSTYTAMPADKGGPTRFGITQASLTAWLGRHAEPDDVRQLNVETAKQIYKVRYWDALRLDRLGAQSVATALMDMAVLNGPKVAVEQMQVCVASVRDGTLGPATLSAINRLPAGDLVVTYAQSMQRRFCAIVRFDSTQAAFLPGWLHRATRMMLLSF